MSTIVNHMTTESNKDIPCEIYSALEHAEDVAGDENIDHDTVKRSILYVYVKLTTISTQSQGFEELFRSANERIDDCETSYERLAVVEDLEDNVRQSL